MEQGGGRHPCPLCNGGTKLAVYLEPGGALLGIFTEVLSTGMLA